MASIYPNTGLRTSTFHSVIQLLIQSFIHLFNKYPKTLPCLQGSIQTGFTSPNLPGDSLPYFPPSLPSYSTTSATLASLMFLKHIVHTSASGPLLLLLVLPRIFYSPVTHFIHLSALTSPNTRSCPRS